MLKYWWRSEREALIRRLELAVETGAIRHTPDAMRSWNREVPWPWQWDGAAHTRICCAWDRRFARRCDDVLGW